MVQQLSEVLINNKVRPRSEGLILTSPPGKCFLYLDSTIWWLFPMGTCLTDTKLWLRLMGGMSANPYGQRLRLPLPALQPCSQDNLAAWVSHPSLVILLGSNTPAQGSQDLPILQWRRLSLIELTLGNLVRLRVLLATCQYLDILRLLGKKCMVLIVHYVQEVQVPGRIYVFQAICKAQDPLASRQPSLPQIFSEHLAEGLPAFCCQLCLTSYLGSKQRLRWAKRTLHYRAMVDCYGRTM